jgi:hypothetical protein
MAGWGDGRAGGVLWWVKFMKITGGVMRGLIIWAMAGEGLERSANTLRFVRGHEPSLRLFHSINAGREPGECVSYLTDLDFTCIITGTAGVGTCRVPSAFGLHGIVGNPIHGR